MAVLPVGIGPVTGYNIERSLRFNSADTAYLNRTFGTSTSTTTFTFSAWVKRSALNTWQGIFTRQGVGSGLWFDTNNKLNVIISGSQNASTAVFRDTSAWYHIVASANGTTITVYVNNSSVLSVSSAWTGMNASTTAHSLGTYLAVSEYFNGYLTEVNFIDGQALTPSSFGQTNANTGVWQPKAYTGTYGTNGFFLKFADNSNNTSTTLGKDSSGNGNNWTPNNFSITAGIGNDSLVDTPTSYGVDTGVGGEVRGNYATLNPIDSSQGTWTIVVNGNLDVTTNAGNSSTILATMAVSSGKWYWEMTPTTVVAATQIGIFNASASVNSTTFLGQDANGWAYSSNGVKYNNNTGVSYGATFTNNDVIGVALDLDAGTLVFYKNGVSQGTAYTGLTGSFKPALGEGSTSAAVVVCNFGQRPFAYTAPSGFKALCTTNLPTPTIGATSTTQANDYFDVSLYTGTGSSLNITGLQFQPDFVWIKGRSGATDHGLYDAVRGVQKQLESNTTTAETTETTGLTAFGSDGFTVGALAQLNTNTATYVAWNWKANGAGSTNTAGTITSTVSANTTSGFSIVSFAFPSVASKTVGHGLGVAPSMVIVKSRSNGTQSWITYHASSGNTGVLILNTTNAFQTNSTSWDNTSPTSTVFTLGSGFTSGNYGADGIAYCFAAVAGYSAFGSYTGNGNADGPFIFTNFRPRYVLVKRTDSTGGWVIFDSSRDTYNVAAAELTANGATAEVSPFSQKDFLSNGFKIRNTQADNNANGGTYIYAAFAESPFKYALAR